MPQDELFGAVVNRTGFAMKLSNGWSLAQRGWTVPHWPKKYGGGGLNSLEQKILQDEMKRINARIPLQSFGIWMLGPALLVCDRGAEAALPQIAKGEIRWCQGYS